LGIDIVIKYKLIA